MVFGIQFDNNACKIMAKTGTDACKIFESEAKHKGYDVDWDKVTIKEKDKYLEIILND